MSAPTAVILGHELGESSNAFGFHLISSECVIEFS
jgi:hypothetical protein